MYNVLNNSDSSIDQNRNEQNVGFDLNVYANAHRFVWVTNKKIPGADCFMDAIIPLVSIYIEVTKMSVDDNQFDLQDLYLEPIGLAWHGLELQQKVF